MLTEQGLWLNYFSNTSTKTSFWGFGSWVHKEAGVFCSGILSTQTIALSVRQAPDNNLVPFHGRKWSSLLHALSQLVKKGLITTSSLLFPPNYLDTYLLNMVSQLCCT